MAAGAPTQPLVKRTQPPRQSLDPQRDAKQAGAQALVKYMSLGFYPPTGPDDPDLALYKAAVVVASGNPKVKAAVAAAAAVCEAEVSVLYVQGEIAKIETNLTQGADAEKLIAEIQATQLAKMKGLLAEVDKQWKRFLSFVQSAVGGAIESQAQVNLIHEGTADTGVVLKPLPDGLPQPLNQGLPFPKGGFYKPNPNPVRKKNTTFVLPESGGYMTAYVWNNDLIPVLQAVVKQADAIKLTQSQIDANKNLQAKSKSDKANYAAEAAKLSAAIPALKTARDAAFAALSGFALGFAKQAAAQICEKLTLDAKTKIRESWIKFTDGWLAQVDAELAEIDALIAKAASESDPDKKKALERLAGAKRAGGAATRSAQVGLRKAGNDLGQQRKGHVEGIKQRQAQTGITPASAASLAGRGAVTFDAAEAEKKVAELDAKTAEQGKKIVDQGEKLIDQGDKLPDDAKAPGVDDKIKNTSEATGQAGIPWWVWLAGGLVAAKILGR